MDTYTTPAARTTQTAKIGDDQRCTITTEVVPLSQAALAARPDQVLAEHADEIRRLSKRLIDDLIEIGRRLTDAKNHAGHGCWLSWLESEFGWSDDTARRYMRLYQFAQEEVFEFRKLRNLQLPASGLYLLAQAKCPLEARKEIAERAEAGETIDCAKIESVVAAYKSPARKGSSHERWRRHRTRKRGKATTEREEVASAITEGSAVALDVVPHVTKRDDVGSGSSSEIENIGLQSEIDKLKSDQPFEKIAQHAPADAVINLAAGAELNTADPASVNGHLAAECAAPPPTLAVAWAAATEDEKKTELRKLNTSELLSLLSAATREDIKRRVVGLLTVDQLLAELERKLPGAPPPPKVRAAFKTLQEAQP
jgi:Protein of unknown function (DUF3102)